MILKLDVDRSLQNSLEQYAAQHCNAACQKGKADTIKKVDEVESAMDSEIDYFQTSQSILTTVSQSIVDAGISSKITTDTDDLDRLVDDAFREVQNKATFIAYPEKLEQAKADLKLSEYNM